MNGAMQRAALFQYLVLKFSPSVSSSAEVGVFKHGIVASKSHSAAPKKQDDGSRVVEMKSDQKSSLFESLLLVRRVDINRL